MTACWKTKNLLQVRGRIKLELKSGSKDLFSSQYLFWEHVSGFHLLISVLRKLEFQLLRRGPRTYFKYEVVLRQIH